MAAKTTMVRGTSAPISTCGDCGMPIQRRLRFCPSCGRPMRFRHSFVVSLWHLVTLWLAVVCVIYAAVAVLRFAAPVTLRVTCVHQVVPSRLVVFPTATYEALLSTGDCSVPRGAVVVLRQVPDWLVAIAARDKTHPAGAVFVQLLRVVEPIGAFTVRSEQRIVQQLRISWENAWTDICTPAWIAPWCAEH